MDDGRATDFVGTADVSSWMVPTRAPLRKVLMPRFLLAPRPEAGDVIESSQ
jgi:hypothetical protein